MRTLSRSRPARAALLALALAAVAIAGCTAPAATTTTTTTGAPAHAAMPALNKTFQVSNAVAEPGAGVEPTASETARLEVPAGYTHMVAQLKATCTSPTCGFGLIYGPDGGQTTFERSGSVDTGVAAGTYVLAARSTGPSAQMTGTITVTLT